MFRIFAITLTLVLSASYALAQDGDDVVSVESTLIVMNAAISDAQGRHVSGLQQNHFKVFEDGVEQPISIFAAEETPFAAVILVDTSGSMEERVVLARAAAIRFLDGLRPRDNVAIYSFDSKVNVIQDFSNLRDVSEHIFDLKAKGMTVLNDAVYQASAELGRRPEKRRAIVVLSDGMDTLSKTSTEKALKTALAANASIYTIDMAAADSPPAQRSASQAVLKKFAEKTGGTFVATPGGVAMREAFRNIVDELGEQYTVGFQPAVPKKDGKWHRLELRVSKPNLTIRTRAGYIAAKPK